MKNKILISFIVMILGGILFSCDVEKQYSTQYPCSFYFDTAKHPTSILTRSLGNPGMWTFVSVQLKQGINHVTVIPNNGEPSEDIPMTTEIENNRVNYNNLGAANSIIVGCSNFNGVLAYDRQCPQCLENNRKKSLEWDGDKQMVKCPSCQLVYMLETGSCTTQSIRLLEYKVAYNGQGTPLAVYN